MATTKRTNSDLQLFIQNAENFIRNNENHIFNEKLLKQGRKLKDISEKYQEETNDAKIEFCEVNEKGIIVYDEKGNFMFTKENMKKLNEKIKAINKKMVSFDLIITVDHLKKLPNEFKHYFESFILSE